MHKLILLIYFCSIWLTSIAQKDSLELIYNDQSKRLELEHLVLPGQTMYAIAQYYDVSIHDIRWANPHISNENKLDYEKISIPISKDQVLYRKPLFVSENKLLPVSYVVKPKDNLFRISRVYFSLPTPLLKKRNGLTNDELDMGQHLHIGWLKENVTDIIVLQGSKANVEVLPFQEAFIAQFRADSSAIVQEKNITVKDNKGSKGLFVMHRKAKAGTYIEIQNPLVNKKAYARVLATIPKNLYSEEIEMVISNELANKIGVLDNRSFLNTKYLR